jgi:hypothetical protein
MKLRTILTRTKTGANGPWSPVVAAKSVAEHLNIPIHNLVQVDFDDEYMNQHKEEGYPTGYGTFVIVTRWKNVIGIFSFVDLGISIVPMFNKFSNTEDKVAVSECYIKEAFYKTVPEPVMLEIAQQIFNTPELLEPKTE